MDRLLTECFESGDFEREMQALYEQIRPYVRQDPTAFFTEEEFAEVFREVVDLCLTRAESIRAQLEEKP